MAKLSGRIAGLNMVRAAVVDTRLVNDMLAVPDGQGEGYSGPEIEVCVGRREVLRRTISGAENELTLRAWKRSPLYRR